MKTQHLGWLSCSLLRGQIIYLKLLVASRTHRVYKRFYKICIVETKRQVKSMSQGESSQRTGWDRTPGHRVGKHALQTSATGVLATCMVLSDISLVQPISRIDRSIVCMGRHMLPLCLLKF